MKWLFGSEALASRQLFRTFEERHFLDMLKTKSLFFAPLSAFRDEFEGTMSMPERWVSGLGPLLSHVVNGVLPRLGDPNWETPPQPPPSKLNWPFDEKPEIDDPDRTEYLLNKAKDFVAASCWSLGKHDWAAHDSVKDIRLQTSPKLLADCLDSGNLSLSAGPTFYPDEFNGLEDGSHSEAIYFRKMSTFQNEDEFRFLTFDPKVNPIKSLKKEYRLHINSFAFIENLEFRDFATLSVDTRDQIEALSRLPR